MHCMIAFVKYEGNTLLSMATLHSIVNYCLLKLQQVNEGTCFGHLMSKAYQYAINDEEVIARLKQVNLKATQNNLQKANTWTKKSRKGRKESERACVERGLSSRKLKTLVKTRFVNKVIMFEDVLIQRNHYFVLWVANDNCFTPKGS